MPRKLVFEVTVIDNTSDDDPTKFGYSNDEEEEENIKNCIYNALGCPEEDVIKITAKLLSRETLDADRDESKAS
jgi:hypothetical protein